MLQDTSRVLNIMAAPKCGTTPLHDAAGNNHLKVVELLVTAGGEFSSNLFPCFGFFFCLFVFLPKQKYIKTYFRGQLESSLIIRRSCGENDDLRPSGEGGGGGSGVPEGGIRNIS